LRAQRQYLATNKRKAFAKTGHDSLRYVPNAMEDCEGK